jgi:hypothetical protein
VPGGQALQIGEPAAAKVPTEQAVQLVERERDVEPAAQAVHAAAPFTVEKVPGAQSAQEFATTYWPATQLEQLTGPPVSVHVLVDVASVHACVVPDEPELQYHVYEELPRVGVDGTMSDEAKVGSGGCERSTTSAAVSSRA